MNSRLQSVIRRTLAPATLATTLVALPILAVFAVPAVLAPVAEAQEGAVLLSEEPSGILALEGENRFSFSGSDVTLSVRVGREGELRFAARARTNRREERPVALWLDGRTLRLERLETSEPPEPLVIEVALSPGVDVDVELTDSVFKANSVQSDVSLRGSRVDTTAIGTNGDLGLELNASTVTVRSVTGALNMSGEGIQGQVEKVAGFVSCTLTNSSVTFVEMTGGAELALEGSVLDVTQADGEFHLDASGGSVTLRELASGAELLLDETPLSLIQTEGAVVVDTNADVRFVDLRGDLQLTGFGGKVTGNGIAGALKISTSSAELLLENLAGASRIDGSDLSVVAKAVQGDLDIVVTASTVVVDDAAGALNVQAEFGNVDLSQVSGNAKITATDGEVLVNNHQGGLEVRAAGPLVDVRWRQLPRETDVVIENTSGDVTLFFPRTAQCRVEAETSFGAIESNVETIRVMSDERRASGVIGRANRPLVSVKAGNNIRIDAGNLPEGGPRRRPEEPGQ